jgi:hypothetical protein
MGSEWSFSRSTLLALLIAMVGRRTRRAEIHSDPTYPSMPFVNCPAGRRRKMLMRVATQAVFSNSHRDESNWDFRLDLGGPARKADSRERVRSVSNRLKVVDHSPPAQFGSCGCWCEAQQLRAPKVDLYIEAGSSHRETASLDIFLHTMRRSYGLHILH